MAVEGSVQWQGEASANSIQYTVCSMQDMGMGENTCGSQYSWGGCIQ